MQNEPNEHGKQEKVQKQADNKHKTQRRYAAEN